MATSARTQNFLRFWQEGFVFPVTPKPGKGHATLGEENFDLVPYSEATAANPEMLKQIEEMLEGCCDGVAVRDETGMHMDCTCVYGLLAPDNMRPPKSKRELAERTSQSPNSQRVLKYLERIYPNEYNALPDF